MLLLLLFAVVLTSTRIIKSVVTGQAPVTLELRNTPGKSTHNPRWYTHISHLTQFMPPPETYKSEIGSQSTMCQARPVHTSHYSRLEKPNIPIATQGRLPHVVSITPHTHDRHKSIGGKETKKRKEDKGKERKEKKNETKRKRQAKRRKRQEKQQKTTYDRRKR